MRTRCVLLRFNPQEQLGHELEIELPSVRKRVSVLSFPHFCPEPVLVK
jgi:hypothetical protein